MPANAFPANLPAGVETMACGRCGTAVYGAEVAKGRQNAGHEPKNAALMGRNRAWFSIFARN